MLPTYETLDRITLADLQALVDTSAPEDDRIEYKGHEAYSEKDAAKKWCKSLSAFANKDGGCILLGVEENKGCASKLSGYDGDADKMILTLSQWAETGIRPRLGFRPKRIDIGGGKQVVLLAIPSSRSKPHMVVCNSDSRCYKRAACHNQPMDIDELRDAVMQSDSPKEMAIHLHRVMIQEVCTGEWEIAGAMALTFYPLPSVVDIIDPGLIPPTQLDAVSSALGIRGESRITFDGWEAHGIRGSRFQLTRDGVVHSLHQGNASAVQNQAVPYVALAGYLVKSVASVTPQLADWTGTDSFLVCFSYLNVKNWKLAGMLNDDWPPITKSDLEFDPIYVEGSEEDPRKTIRVWMDRLWQACGVKRCDLYDENGEPDEERWREVPWK